MFVGKNIFDTKFRKLCYLHQKQKFWELDVRWRYKHRNLSLARKCFSNVWSFGEKLTWRLRYFSLNCAGLLANACLSSTIEIEGIYFQ